MYPPASGTREFLAYHLKKGNARDVRYCLRIYFFWNAKDQQVVVGSLPGHLSTRVT